MGKLSQKSREVEADVLHRKTLAHMQQFWD
jgi:hypothetical protein